ncbi:hypothetical protein WQ54_03005 [Bacillus sp. SA1-12]|uniref:DUF3813 domain-containing protein n=1 Tax=Bacillus sp. SA1-12 TaxID=1455638 RepID=UPI0006262CFE|nr:DUF3813 domain-containing protein [Bacillus sp. SA1-12]KKI93594.1 hypothetical protein WQ54_03005 [Bacillus sp. SA1-12]
MGNQLFQQARESVAYAANIASGSVQGDKYEAILKAKNALSSAYTNCTDAERAQLREFQKTINSI